MVKSFNQLLQESDLNQYEVTYNWNKEIHKFKVNASSPDQAHHAASSSMGKKLKRSKASVMGYFEKNPTSMKVKVI